MFFRSQVLLLTTLVWLTTAAPLHREKSENKIGRLAVQVIRSAEEFIAKSPERELSIIEETTSTNGERAQREFVPFSDWYKKTFLARLKKNKRRTRRRHKRGAKINHDASYISEFPTNRRLYKLANKLGYYLRIHADGTVDGTANRNDPKSKTLYTANSRF